MPVVSEWRYRLHSWGAWLVPGFCIALIALMWVAVARQVDYERAAAIAQREREQDNLARLFEEHVLGVLTTASATIREVETEYRRHGARLDLARYLRERPELHLVRNIGITDSSGLLVVNSVPLHKPTSVRDTENFQYHLNSTSRDIYISKPRLGVATAVWNIRISRRMNRADGALDGNITVGLDPGYFSRFYDQIALGPDSLVSLVGRDGTVRARRRMHKCSQSGCEI